MAWLREIGSKSVRLGIYALIHSKLSCLLFSTRLDYQPLFGKMIPHSSPGDECWGIKDRTQETAEIEPSFLQDRTTVKHFVETAGRVSVISPLFSQ